MIELRDSACYRRSEDESDAARKRSLKADNPPWNAEHGLRDSVCLLSVLCTPQSPADDSILWYPAPAQSWEKEALPIGNGRLGGMVFGGIEQRTHSIQ